MDKEFLETFAKAFIEDLSEKSTAVFQGLHGEAKQMMKKDLNLYFQNEYKKHAFVKTVLRGMQPTYLYDIYFHGIDPYNSSPTL